MLAQNILLMTKYQNKAVYLDPEVLVSGDGSATSPFKYVQETKDFAEANGILTVYVYSDVVIPSSVKNFTVIGIGTPTVNCNSQDLKNTEFIGCKMLGNYTGNIKLRRCELDVTFVLNGESLDVDDNNATNHALKILDIDAECV